MSKKHYVVWRGAVPGIYDSWPQCQAQVNGRKDAQYMGFPSFEEAQAAYAKPYSDALSKRVKQKGGSGGGTQAKSAANPKAKKATKAATNNSADINIYCDGACSPNPGKSGTGIALYEKEQLSQLWYGLYEANGTNNTAELNGLLEAFKLSIDYIKQNKTVQILSDSKYSIDCITKWAKGWKAKGWKRAGGEEVKNLELIQTCYHYYDQIKNHITISHVRGHADIEGNELSDRMAVLARTNHETGFVQNTEVTDIPTILAMPSG